MPTYRPQRRKLGILRPVSIVTPDDARSPFTYGILKPVIVIPYRLIVSIERCGVESIITHELAHIRRLDTLWTPLASLIKIVFFFHPVVWYVAARLRLEQERSCDAIAIAHTSVSSEEYAMHLLAVARTHSSSRGFANMMLGSSLKRRIRAILSRRTLSVPWLAVPAICIAVLFLPVADSKDRADITS